MNSVDINDICGGVKITFSDNTQEKNFYLAEGWRWWLRRGVWWLLTSFGCGLVLAFGYALGQWLFGSPW